MLQACFPAEIVVKLDIALGEYPVLALAFDCGCLHATGQYSVQHGA